MVLDAHFYLIFSLLFPYSYIFCRVVINRILKLSSYRKHVLSKFTKSRKINKVVKRSKRKVRTVSPNDAVADISNWVENPDNDENFELEINRSSDDSDDSDEERGSIESEQREEIEEPHVSRYRKILTSSRLVHSIDSELDPDNYDDITYPNKGGC